MKKRGRSVKILICDKLSEKGKAVFDEEQIPYEEKIGLSPEELAQAVKGFDALVIRSGAKVTREVIEAADQLKAIGRAGVGVDNIDLEAASAKGVLVMNTSLIDSESGELAEGCKVLAIPADDIAVELGNQKVANMVAVGAYLQAKELFSPDAAVACLAETIAQRYHKMLPVNTEALHRGAEFAKDRG